MPDQEEIQVPVQKKSSPKGKSPSKVPDCFHDLTRIPNLDALITPVIPDSNSDKYVISNLSKYIPAWAFLRRSKLFDTDNFISRVPLNIQRSTYTGVNSAPKILSNLNKMSGNKAGYNIAGVNNHYIHFFSIFSHTHFGSDYIKVNQNAIEFEMTFATMNKNPTSYKDYIVLVKEDFQDKSILFHRLIKSLAVFLPILKVKSVNEMIFATNAQMNSLLTQNEELRETHLNKLKVSIIDSIVRGTKIEHLPLYLGNA